MKFLEKRKFIHRPINRCENVRTRQFAVQARVGPQKKEFRGVQNICALGGLERKEMNTCCLFFHVNWNSLIKKITSPTAKRALGRWETQM